LNANEAFVRAAFHSQGKISKALADYATWTVTGVAAIIGALLVNSESVTKAVEPHMLKWGMVVLICSLVIGGLCKQAGEAFLAGLESIESLVATLSTLDSSYGGDLDQAVIEKELVDGYLWPMSMFIKRSFAGGTRDNLHAEKRLMKVLSIQIFAAWLQTASAAGGLIVLAFGLR